MRSGTGSKGIIFDIKKYSIHDGPGIRTTVFLKGCPLRCWWCQNPESQNADPDVIVKETFKREYYTRVSDNRYAIGKEVDVKTVIKEIEKDLIFYDESGGGVTFSGGEPLMQPDFLSELLQECRTLDLHTAVDTTGYAAAEIVENIADMTDLFLYDLKIINNALHEKYTGVPVKLVLDNLSFLAAEGKNVLVRIPVIPGITDTDENISDIIEFLDSLKNFADIDLLPFNHFGFSKYNRLGIENKMADVKQLKAEDVETLKKHFQTRGFNVSIGG